MNATENRIVLTPEESRVFLERMDHPDETALARRDASADAVRVTATPTGFTVEAAD